MNYFMIEGTIIHEEFMNDTIMKQHMDYTQKAIDDDILFMSGLKKDMSGGICMMKAETKEEIEHYLAAEPLYLHQIQTYKILEFDYHYVNEKGTAWFM